MLGRNKTRGRSIRAPVSKTRPDAHVVVKKRFWQKADAGETKAVFQRLYRILASRFRPMVTADNLDIFDELDAGRDTGSLKLSVRDAACVSAPMRSISAAPLVSARNDVAQSRPRMRSRWSDDGPTHWPPWRRPENRARWRSSHSKPFDGSAVRLPRSCEYHGKRGF